MTATNKDLFQNSDAVELDSCKDSNNVINCANRTMFFDANVAITNGKGFIGTSNEVKTIPNLYEAIKNSSQSIRNSGNGTSTSITCFADKIIINLNGAEFDLAAVIEAVIELNRRTAFINSNKTFTATKTEDTIADNAIDGTKNAAGDGMPGGTNEGIV